MFVAFASKDGVRIDSHFAGADQFVIYNVEENDLSVREVICFGFQEGVGHKGQHNEGEDDDKVQKRIKALIECSIIYCTNIGGPAAARLVQNRIHPLKVANGSEIEQQLLKLQNMLKNNPPPWLKKGRN